MHAITNNLATSNLQVSYNNSKTNGNMSQNQVGHDMSKMNEVGSKDQMKANCNMKQMHQDSTVSSSVKSDSSSKAVDSNLGGNLDIQV